MATDRLMPMLLDLITIFCLVGGCVLLWFNLRPRRSDVIITPVANSGPFGAYDESAQLGPKMSNNSVCPREIAGAILIDTHGRYLLQQRDDIIGIIHPGKVGLFGGHREGDESYLECIVREIHEEISYYVPAEHFEHLVSLDGTDMDVDGGSVRGEFFVARNIPVDALVITEGTLLIIKMSELLRVESRLTPSAKFAMNAYFDTRTFGQQRAGPLQRGPPSSDPFVCNSRSNRRGG